MVGRLGGGAEREELHHGGVAPQGLIPVSRSWKELNKSKDGVPSVSRSDKDGVSPVSSSDLALSVSWLYCDLAKGPHQSRTHGSA